MSTKAQGSPKIETTAALFTYSSVIRSGDEFLQPSRLSLLAAHAAGRAASGGSDVRLIIAGEQSYQDYPETTGELLDRAGIFPANVRVDVRRNDDNRLLNTPFQVEELVDYYKNQQQSETMTVYGWDFHRRRIQTLFGAIGPDVPIVYQPVDPILAEMDANDELSPILEKIGIEVPYETVVQRALHAYARREVITRLSLLPNKKGKVLNLLTGIRKVGRYDDITPDGFAYHSTTG